MTPKLTSRVGRRSILGALAAGTILSPLGFTAAQAQDVSGELVMINWLAGSQAEMMEALQADFIEKNPEVTFRNIVPTSSGDTRGGIRTVLLGGEQADLLINTWPAFRQELLEAGMILPVDEAWEENNWSDLLADSWKELSSIDGVNYGVTYTFGDRSAIWYNTGTLEKAGITPPETWEDFIAGFDDLNAAGITPISVPAKIWAHAEWFESTLLRVAGADFMTQLAKHEVPWTSPEVVTAFEKMAEMLNADCCTDANTMLASVWTDSADTTLKTGESGYMLIGMWLNTRAKAEYGLEPGTDFDIVQFPAFGLGHDDQSMVDAKEFNVLATVQNPEAANAFMGYMLTADAAQIMADYGLASPSSAVDPSIYDPVVQRAVSEVTQASKVQFVLGDLLPGDLVHEYRIQIQKFLQDPSDETIAAAVQKIEDVANASY
ncbi:ABC transporter substrate-binding protein [Vannielia litorea]|uniref:Carbohydrate ABC transporter substrate-binding protein, CUT1 family n=1 Tax=Vannielia litorea TaxID=1217970 RepID=A0A1N6E1N5_9RHOB|nr:ABC transporter substrate-binding protein [Vannielia litorea]SIN76911.1 carbohydrate ABC transporter substrate-binding protein, CUT1 family [Vannielia litorea]